jgi:hypothetical protein
MKSIRDPAIIRFALLALPLAAQIPVDPVAWLKAENALDATPFTGPGYVDGDSASPGVKTVEIRDTVNISDASSNRFLRGRVTR